MKLTSFTPWAFLAGLLLSGPASALNILLTNDDSWHTANIQTLADALRANGHDVIMSAPCTGQSGKGGSISFLKAVGVDTSKAAQQEYCVGDTDETVPFEDFVEGTPVMAALYGIDVLAPAIWGGEPDLVISGPNEGNNLGYLNNTSGTLGATMVSIARGIPAIAVSAADGDEDKAGAVAGIVVEIVAQLESSRRQGEALLPPFTGLNVNTPANVTDHNGYRFTRVAWNSGGINPQFVEDMSQDETSMTYIAAGIAESTGMSLEEARAIAEATYAGRAGISVAMGGDLVDDDSADAEGRLVNQGYITISTIDAQVQASRAKTALTARKLDALSR
ncbi:Acid phosphatase stationary-phase survival protein [Alloalcanivorax dieselolei B5]|uniref:5'-nucleotidase n=1 Tax=Alcanivorax dieselolei (strain DSM 16502 / CGMCC 1.3690 / MCCC 1A00001 / B-5) TaxID=930169 RepID=K0CHL7_ALCDB|nr:5'/3'-nucleotidase SurE [Alloalcanivorax dieselolei]AFT71202.1 Acid phosphatase stationary-phase survival protein [Alloalcanivorax dieselolei B5]GGJ93903.1 hypothetical protein GCM10007426_23580 [Alloalcanivorax dieselolei]